MDSFCSMVYCRLMELTAYVARLLYPREEGGGGGRYMYIFFYNGVKRLKKSEICLYLNQVIYW